MRALVALALLALSSLPACSPAHAGAMPFGFGPRRVGATATTFRAAMLGLATQPTAWWHLDEGSGNIADAAGTRTGTQNGTPLYGQTGIVSNDPGTAIASNSSGYFSFTSLALTANYTVAFWYKSATGSDTGQFSFFANATTDDGKGAVANYGNYFRMYDDTTTLLSAANVTVAANTRAFLVFRRSGSANTSWVNNANHTDAGGTGSGTVTLQYMFHAKGVLGAETMQEAAIWVGTAISDADEATLWGAGQ